MTKLNAIHVSAFRGIRQETIELTGKSLFVHGENGTGKSSIIDSLEFFFTGSVSHLEGVQSLSTKRHAVHVSLGPENLSVGMGFQGYDGTLTRTLQESPVATKSLAPLLEKVSATRFILRRQQLLEFILAQAAPRYQQLAQLIGADELDTVELAWKAAADESQAHVQTLLRRAEESRHVLQSIYGEVGDLSDEAVLLGALNGHIASLGQSPLSSVSEIEPRKLQVLQAAGHKERAALAARLDGLRTQGAQIADRLRSLAAHRDLWEGLEALHSEVDRIRELRFRDVLFQAQALIREYELTSCPVCTQPIESAPLAESLNARVMQSDALANRMKELDVQRRKLRDDLATLRSAVNALHNAIQADESLASVHAAAVKMEQWCQQFGAKLISEIHNLELGPFAAFAEAEVVQTLTAGCDELHATFSARIQSLAETDADKQAVELIALLTRTSDSFGALTEATTNVTAARKEAAAISLIYGTLVETKKSHIQAIYSQLEGDFTRYYNIIHPQEAHSGIKLEVVASKRGSAEIRMGFADKAAVDPRAYNSEAHLDSLGLCIFLAFARRFNVGVPFLALDDVVSSVDASHRGRICELLFSEFADYQLFITTHDELWFEQLLARQRAMKFQPVRVLRIVNWTLDDGPRFSDHAPRWETIEAKLQKGDKQGAASLTRKTLEWMLFELALQVDAPVVLRRDARYDVGALKDPVFNRIKKLIPTFAKTYQPAITAFESNLLIANLLTHYNSFAENASISDVRAFVEATKGIHDTFWCDSCGEFAKYYKEFNTVRCHCVTDGKAWATK